MISSYLSRKYFSSPLYSVSNEFFGTGYQHLGGDYICIYLKLQSSTLIKFNQNLKYGYAFAILALIMRNNTFKGQYSCNHRGQNKFFCLIGHFWDMLLIISQFLYCFRGTITPRSVQLYYLSGKKVSFRGGANFVTVI